MPEAPDLASAVDKAEQWLLGHYGAGSVVLVDPAAEDEREHAWLFSTTTQRFTETGDWRDQRLDAGLVVPKNTAEPFLLFNPDPWTHLRAWEEGGAEIPTPPEPGPAAWFRDTMAQLGEVRDTGEHADWPGVLAQLVSYPEGSRALVWVRRLDSRGRESTGMLFNAAMTPAGLMLLDGMRNQAANLETEGVHALHVVRYR